MQILSTWLQMSSTQAQPVLGKGRVGEGRRGELGCSPHTCSLLMYFQRPQPSLLLLLRAQSSLGIMEKGITGLLASSSRAVRKQSMAASFWPWACSTSPRPCQASW